MHLVYKALEKYTIPSCLPPELIPPSKRKDSLPLPGSVQVLPAVPNGVRSETPVLRSMTPPVTQPVTTAPLVQPIPPLIQSVPSPLPTSSFPQPVTNPPLIPSMNALPLIPPVPTAALMQPIIPSAPASSIAPPLIPVAPLSKPMTPAPMTITPPLSTPAPSPMFPADVSCLLRLFEGIVLIWIRVSIDSKYVSELAVTLRRYVGNH